MSFSLSSLGVVGSSGTPRALKRAKSLSYFKFGLQNQDSTPRSTRLLSRQSSQSSRSSYFTNEISTTGTDITESSLDFTETMETFRVLLEQRILDSLFKLGAISFLIAFIVYWLALEPELDWLEALYFTMATFTTVGYGDIRPTSTSSRIFTVFLLYITILPVALALAATAEYLATRLEVERLHREQLLITAIYADDDNLYDFKQQKPKLGTSVNEQDVAVAIPIPSPGYVVSEKEDSKVDGKDEPGGHEKISPHKTTTSDPKPTVVAPVMNEGEIAFQSQASEPWPWLVLKMMLTVLIVAVVYIAVEGMDDVRDESENNERRKFGLVKAVYFATATATTIGYGDVYPKTDVGRACAIVYMPLSLAVFGNGIGAVAQVIFRILMFTTTDGEEGLLVRRHAIRKGGLSKGIQRCRHWKTLLFPNEEEEEEEELERGGDLENKVKTKKKRIRLGKGDHDEEENDRLINEQCHKVVSKDVPTSSLDDIQNNISSQEDDMFNDNDDVITLEERNQGISKGADKFEFNLLMLLALGKIELKTITDVHALLRERKDLQKHEPQSSTTVGGGGGGGGGGIAISSKAAKKAQEVEKVKKSIDATLLKRRSRMKIWPLVASLLAVLVTALAISLSVSLGQSDVFNNTERPIKSTIA